jgi:hypothetical protein
MEEPSDQTTFVGSSLDTDVQRRKNHHALANETCCQLVALLPRGDIQVMSGNLPSTFDT